VAVKLLRGDLWWPNFTFSLASWDRQGDREREEDRERRR
jgi:hypothetical protein